MEPMQERIAALEHAVQELSHRQRQAEQQLRRWRGLAGLLALGALLLPSLPIGRAAAARDLKLAARLAARPRLYYYQAPRVRRTAPRTTPTLTVRVGDLERAVNYQENQIQSLGTALNQELAARQAAGTGLPAPAPAAAQPPPAPADSPFTDAQATTLKKLAGLLVVSGDTIRCNGDLALTLGHPLLTNQIAPIDGEGHPDDHGTTEFSGNVSVAKKLSSSATAKVEPQ